MVAPRPGRPRVLRSVGPGTRMAPPSRSDLPPAEAPPAAGSAGRRQALLRSLRRLGRLASAPRGLLVFQVAVAVLLVAGAAWFLDWRALLREAAGVEPAALAIAGGALVAVLLVGAFDLWVLLAGVVTIGYGTTLRVYVVGWASFLALPGSAGDAVQILLLRDADVEYRQGTAVYLADKLATLAVTLAVVAAGGWIYFRDRVRVGLLLLLAAAGLLAAAALYLLLRRSTSRLARRAFDLLGSALAFARRHPGRMAANLTGTVAKLLLAAVAVRSLFLGLGVDVPLAVVFVVHHAAALVAYLPVAFNGIGTVELAAVALYGSVGVAAQDVVALYIVLRGLVLALAVLALGAQLLGRGRSRPRASRR